ncbi:Hypothetical predicted protein [Olea europaea subsp. europaea]|uniref:Uncharacterized protein n=1 Tax=Olea europaea subsp. europaea TaxID=158383 RepID=A0A8S0U0T1_OLEEU|nr:Hypothetical predicted protein [Olea europaea subsp. europaea]
MDWTSKIVLLISTSFFLHIKKLKIYVIGASNNNGGSESGGDAQLDLTRYVILLPGEPGIPKKTLKNFWNEEPPNSWCLPLVTLTFITIALPNVSDDSANQLVRRVGEGLTLLKFIDKSLDKNRDLEIIRKAAEVREIPNLDPGKATYIDEWRTFIEEDNGNSLASISSIGSETQQSNEEHVAIELENLR